MPDTAPSSRSFADALTDSDSPDAFVFFGAGAMSDADIDALLAWQASAGNERRTVTLVKSPIRSVFEVIVRVMCASSSWVVLPLNVIEPEARLRAKSPDLRVAIARRSRRCSLELSALCDGAVLHWP